LSNEVGIDFVAFLAAEKCDFRFVLADFAHQRRGFALPNVRRIAGNDIKKKWRVTPRLGSGQASG
jgi:hypothetical protein